MRLSSFGIFVVWLGKLASQLVRQANRPSLSSPLAVESAFGSSEITSMFVSPLVAL